ncbi:MAG: DUF4469 domain-containing protein [Treponematales bacterium]
MDFARFHNALSAQEGDYLVRALNVRSLTQAEFCRRCEDRHEGFTANQMEAAIRLITAELRRALEEETGVRLEFGSVTPGVRGVIHPAAGRGDVEGAVTMSPSREVREAAAGWRFEEKPANQAGPVVTAVEDTVSGAVSSGVTADGIVIVTGHNLKVEGADGGVFFRNASGAETAVTTLAENLSGRLLFKAPADLPQGVYRLVVRTHYSGGGTPSKDVKVTEFPVDLMVPPAAAREG